MDTEQDARSAELAAAFEAAADGVMAPYNMRGATGPYTMPSGYDEAKITAAAMRSIARVYRAAATRNAAPPATEEEIRAEFVRLDLGTSWSGIEKEMFRAGWRAAERRLGVGGER